MQTTDFIIIALQTIFLLILGYYVILNLQWYHYKLTRVVFKHHKWRWHIYYFLIPILYFVLIPYDLYYYLGLLVYFVALGIWALTLSKKLVFTGRILRFFGIYIGFILFNELLLLTINTHNALIQFVHIIPLLIAIFLSAFLEKVLLNRYKQVAKDKLSIMPGLTIIAITGSYGKTSLKNFISQILKAKYTVYSTPRSVNTLTGIIADINQNLSSLTDIYVVEAGARESGDIREIIELLEPQIVVVGKVGEAHIEYFKSIDKIYETKYEILESKRLQKVYIYKENTPPAFSPMPISYFPQNISNINATLDGTEFSLVVKGSKLDFKTEVLGAFNATNISAAISIAKDLGVENELLIKQVAKLQPIHHRLNKITVNNKIILDDSYNGNIDGMKEAIRLSSLYEGRKIIITPGLVESREKLNKELAQEIDKVFDIAIITGELNSKILKNNIFNAQKIILKDRSNIETLLKNVSLEKDLILFANDAPSYI